MDSFFHLQHLAQRKKMMFLVLEKTLTSWILSLSFTSFIVILAKSVRRSFCFVSRRLECIINAIGSNLLTDISGYTQLKQYY